MQQLLAYVCFSSALLFAVCAAAQTDTDRDPRSIGGGSCKDNAYNCVGAPNPLPAVNTIWIEEMTWMDVRDALAAGKRTVIIPAGGIEPNGPWLALGKHDYIAHLLCEAIARKLGNALCAPVVSFVPEGDLDLQTGHMKSPGTTGVREETYEALISDIARSMKAHGFDHIILIGDHGDDEKGMTAVAAKLTEEWSSTPAVFYIPEYYKASFTTAEVLKKRGVLKAGVSDGLHDDPATTLLLMVTDPDTVRWQARIKAGKATIDGVSVADKTKAVQWGRELAEYRATVTTDAITRAVAGSKPH